MSRKLVQKSKLHNRKYGIKKVAVTVLAAILLLILYSVIFDFSSQDAESSGSVSMQISTECIQLINQVRQKKWSLDTVRDYAAFIELPIRKLAHFSEYACMGMLVYIMLRQWMERNKKLYGITVFWIFLSASFDEIHQLFSPGRACSIKDVILDTCGCIFAVCVCVIIEKIYSKFKKAAQG